MVRIVYAVGNNVSDVCDSHIFLKVLWNIFIKFKDVTKVDFW